VPAHQELAVREAAGESINAIGVVSADTNGDAAEAPVEDDEPAGVVAEAVAEDAEPAAEAVEPEEGDSPGE
jgi:hypothetical protein